MHSVIWFTQNIVLLLEYLLKGLLVQMPTIIAGKIESAKPGNILIVIFTLVGMWTVVRLLWKLILVGFMIVIGYAIATSHI